MRVQCLPGARVSDDGTLHAALVGVVHAWVGQIVTFFVYRPPSRPLGSLTPDVFHANQAPPTTLEPTFALKRAVYDA